MYRLTSPLGLIARPLFAALGLSLLAWAPAARGDLYQGFDRYPLGPGVEPGSLADPTGTLATSGNRLRSLDVTSYDAGPLETWGTPGTNVWVSWLQRRDQNRLGFQGFVVTAPLPGSTTTRYGVFFAGEPGSGPGDNTLVIGQASNDLNVVSSGVPVVPNQTYFLVAHFQFREGNDLATLYVNPTPGSVEPTGGTTFSNLDMPIVQPPSFDSLGLVSFQINPHYVDPDPASQHMGETREERIVQFLEENSRPVVGLREGAMIRIEGDSIVLKGTAGARLFRSGQPALALSPGISLGEMVNTSA